MRLIDGDLAVAKCNEDIEAVKDISQRVDGILDAIMNIHECPTVDAVPVKHGKWIPHEDEDGEHYGDKCSECGEWYVMPYGKTNFCPNCGAKMEGFDETD